MMATRVAPISFAKQLGISLIQDNFETKLLGPLNGALGGLFREQTVLADDGDPRDADLLCQVQRALLIILGDRSNVEEVLPALLPNDAGRRARRRSASSES